MDSSSLISRIIWRIFCFVSSLRWPSLTCSRKRAMSISILSVVSSSCSIWRNSSEKSFGSVSWNNFRTSPNISPTRCPKAAVSFCACRTAISGVCTRFDWMYCKLNSSVFFSAFSFSGSNQQTARSICGTSQMSMAVLMTLKQVWNMASTTGNLAVCPPADGS